MSETLTDPKIISHLDKLNHRLCDAPIFWIPQAEQSLFQMLTETEYVAFSDPYSILGVSRTTTNDEVISATNKLVFPFLQFLLANKRKLNSVEPDVQYALNIFKQIVFAQKLLLNKELRQLVDRILNNSKPLTFEMSGSQLPPDKPLLHVVQPDVIDVSRKETNFQLNTDWIRILLELQQLPVHTLPIPPKLFTSLHYLGLKFQQSRNPEAGSTEWISLQHNFSKNLYDYFILCITNFKANELSATKLKSIANALSRKITYDWQPLRETRTQILQLAQVALIIPRHKTEILRLIDKRLPPH